MRSLKTEEAQHDPQLQYRKKLFYRDVESYYKRFRAKVDFEKEENPRQFIGIFFLIFLLIIVQYLGGTIARPDQWESSVKLGFYSLSISIVFYCYFQTRDGLLVRPHPGFWRIIHGINTCHVMAMTILLCIPVSVGRELVWSLLPGLKDEPTEIFEGTLELSCDFSIKTVLIQVRKIWFYSHIIGYFAKMIITRDWIFCLILSVAFELIELSFQWFIPELKECWWDSLILDVAVSNMIGMIIGAVTLRCINCLPYDWFNSAKRRISPPAKMAFYKSDCKKNYSWQWTRATLQRFQPFLWSTYHWQFFRSFERLAYSVAILIITLLTEFNVFMFMYAFNIPAMNHFHKIRVTYMCFLAVSAVAEAYHYLCCKSQSKKNMPHLGPNSWLYSTSIILETIVLFRYNQHRLVNLVPNLGIIIPWVGSVALFSIWCGCHFVIVGAERLDLKQDLWNRCLELTRVKSDHDEESIVNKLVEEGLTQPEQIVGGTPQDVLQSDSAALKLLFSFLFLGNDTHMSQCALTMSKSELQVIVKKMLSRRHQWGRLYGISAHIVSFPVLLSFCPLLALFSYYKFD